MLLLFLSEKILDNFFLLDIMVFPDIYNREQYNHADKEKRENVETVNPAFMFLCLAQDSAVQGRALVINVFLSAGAVKFNAGVVEGRKGGAAVERCAAVVEICFIR